MTDASLILPIQSELPIQVFVPTLPLKNVHSGLNEESGIAYLYFQVSEKSVLNLEYAEELCLPLIDVYHLKYDDEYCGYFFRSKSPFLQMTNSSIVSFSAGYKRNICREQIPETNLVYSTKFFSAFSSLSGCNMILRQFTSQSFIEKLEV